jgi:DNA-binding PadR family transcriptional regulator
MARTDDQAVLERDLLRGSRSILILSALADGPQYGYLIQQQVRRASGGRVLVTAGTLYPLLHRLEADGAIRAKWDRTTGRDRKWYALTARGRRRLQREAATWRQFVMTISTILDRAAPQTA